MNWRPIQGQLDAIHRRLSTLDACVAMIKASVITIDEQLLLLRPS
jgi:hypothetical protein